MDGLGGALISLLLRDMVEDEEDIVLAPSIG